jgi:predicted MFS family arabinose efflux permease
MSADSRFSPELAAALTISTTIQILATASVLSGAAVAPLLTASLGVGGAWIGYQVSFMYFAGMGASAVAGALVLRFGPYRIEQALLAAFALGLLALASGSLWGFAFGSALIGIGYGLNNPASSHILNAVTPHAQRNLVYSVKQAGVPLGAVLASLAFPPLAEHFGWRPVFACAGAAPALAAVALGFRRHDVGFAPIRSTRLFSKFAAEQQLVWKSPALRALAALGLLYSAAQLSLSAFAVTMLCQEAGWSLVAAGGVAALMQAAGAVGRVFWGVVADWIGDGFVVLGGLGLASGALGATILAFPRLSPVAQTLILIGLGFCLIGWNGVLLAETARRAPHGQVGPTTGAVLVYIFLGVILGPASFAALYAWLGGYGYAFAAFGVLTALGAPLAWRARAELANLDETAANAA